MEETSPPTDREEAPAGKSAGGLLLVDKPSGITSHDVVQRVRQIYGERSIGHLGTLDPFATGLLVLLIGRATRLATFLETEPKVYDATITFGSETDTDDETGTVTRSAVLPAVSEVRTAITALTGSVSQVPPDYSAKSVAGVRAYDAARRGTSQLRCGEDKNIRLHAGKLESPAQPAGVAANDGTSLPLRLAP